MLPDRIMVSKHKSNHVESFGRRLNMYMILTYISHKNIFDSKSKSRFRHWKMCALRAGIDIATLVVIFFFGESKKFIFRRKFDIVLDSFNSISSRLLLKSYYYHLCYW